MTQDIAVFVGENGMTAAANEQGIWKIYRRQSSGWRDIRELSIHIDETAGLVKLRQQLANVIAFLADCRIVVAATVTGIPFFEFEKAACNVWEFTGYPQDFLDYILVKEQEMKKQQAVAEPVSLPVPENLGNGHFRISIKNIQSNHSGFTSKQVLQDFFKRGEFYSLDVLCSHIPPWLEGELLLGKYQVATEQRNPQEVKLTITKSCCFEPPSML